MVLPALSPLRLLLAGLLIVLLAGPAHRFGLLPFRPALGLLGVGVLVVLGGTVVMLLGMIAELRQESRPELGGLMVLMAGLFVLGSVGRLAVAGVRLPAIHDISTDTTTPPEFIEVVALRAGAPNPAAYDGPAVAELQRQAYPEIVPLRLNRAADDVLIRAEIVARASGWTIHAVTPATGVIEATATTRWFGFADDVVVRLTADSAGTRVDMRSKSRVGRHDFGANATRIRKYLGDLQRDVEG